MDRLQSRIEGNGVVSNILLWHLRIASQNVDVLKWAPYSSDQNIIESVWGWVVKKVYEDYKQYTTKEELIDGIRLDW